MLLAVTETFPQILQVVPEEVPTPLDSRDESEVEQAGLFSTTLQEVEIVRPKGSVTRS